MGYNFSKKADMDLKKIYKYTVKNFGQNQAIKYIQSLESGFLLLGESPRIGQNISYLKKNVFCHKHQSHFIFYRIKKDHIFIIRLLHESMKSSKHL